MKFIGNGLQYNVYDIGNGRVRKLYSSKKDKLKTLKGWGVIGKAAQEKLVSIEKHGQYSISRIKKHLNPKNEWLLGNPLFLNKLDYEQDKIIPITAYFSKNDVGHNKKVIDQFIKVTLQLWDFGISDTIFNLTINNGVTKSGKVILSDLGELTFSKREVESMIKSRKWLAASSYTEIHFRGLSEYYSKTALKHLTLDNLNKRWKSKI